MKKRLLALVLALSLLLSACGGTKAASMHLRRTEGTVGVSDDGGKKVAPREDLGLYSGYGVDTQAASYAWIDLDSVKLVKLDENSEISITKSGKALEIDVVSGGLFFNVTEPLAGDETMTIRTSNMMVGIRGTCGWVTQDTAALLEGTVEVTAGDQAVTISAGEMAVLTADGTLTVAELSGQDIPAFVLTEVENKDELMGTVSGGASAGTMPADHVMDWRDEALAAKMAEVTGITDREIMLSDVWEMDDLSLWNAGISDISALSELTNLRQLSLNENNISDISALSGLTGLTSLDLRSNNIHDISALSDLSGLTWLLLSSNNISDISALSRLTGLTHLEIYSNDISDISALGGLTELQSLTLSNNDISDVSALHGLTSLTSLSLGDNNITDISALSSLTGLQFLDLIGDPITDYSPVEFVPDLYK